MMPYDAKRFEELELEIWKLKGRVERLENQTSNEEKGDFRNILHMEALTPMGATHTGGESLEPSFLSPAFFEMCANQATQLLAAKNAEWNDEVYKELVRRLYKINKELKEELEANPSFPPKKMGGEEK